jgi:hypothetical protein
LAKALSRFLVSNPGVPRDRAQEVVYNQLVAPPSELEAEPLPEELRNKVLDWAERVVYGLETK